MVKSCYELLSLLLHQKKNLTKVGWELWGGDNEEQAETPKGIDPNKHILGSLFHLCQAIKHQFLYMEVYYVFIML